MAKRVNYGSTPYKGGTNADNSALASANSNTGKSVESMKSTGFTQASPNGRSVSQVARDANGGASMSERG